MFSKTPSLVLICALICCGLQSVECDLFPLSIIHINDFHARYEPTDTNGGTCEDDEVCVGGLARTVYTVKKLLDELKDTNPIYINAGDSFQGTLWYNVGRWNVTSQLLNLLPADAMTLGNHEFDHGVEGVVPFLETIKTEMLVANMDARDEPTMQNKYKKSTIIEKNGRKIGMIGVILETTYDLANTGKLIFYNESDTIREEAAKLKEQGANIIIVISHCGYDVDKIIAENAGSEIDVIIGSHSHTFLYTGTPPGPDTPRGPYPTEVTHESGHRVLIVQASAYARYVGNITVYFDEKGDVVDFEGAPIYMGAEVPQDPEVLKALIPFRQEVETMKNTQIGEAKKPLLEKKCFKEECALGDLWTDSMVNKMQEVIHQVNIALVYHQEMKSHLNKGPITLEDIFKIAPYNTSLVAVQLKGNYLQEILEESLSSLQPNVDSSSSKLFQVSGLEIKISSKANQQPRILQVFTKTLTNSSNEKALLDPLKNYWVVVSKFIYTAGFGHSIFKDFGENPREFFGEFDALKDLIKKRKIITNNLDGRIIFV